MFSDTVWTRTGKHSRLSVEPRVFVSGWWRWELKLVVCVLIKTTVHHGGRNPYFQRERITPDKQKVLLLCLWTFPPLLLRSSFLFVYYIFISFIFFPFTFVSHRPLLVSFTLLLSFPLVSPFHLLFSYLISVSWYPFSVSCLSLAFVFYLLSSLYFSRLLIFFHQNQYKIGFLRSILFYFHNAYWPLVSTGSSLNDFFFPFPSFLAHKYENTVIKWKQAGYWRWLAVYFQAYNVKTITSQSKWRVLASVCLSQKTGHRSHF